MQLAAGLVRVVDAGDAEAQLEPQVGVVPQGPRHGEQVLAADEHRHLATVDGDPLDGLGVGGGAADQGALESVGQVVEVAAVGPLRRAGQQDRAAQTAVARRVLAVRGPEHAEPLTDDDGVGVGAGRGRQVRRVLLGRLLAALLSLALGGLGSRSRRVAHASRPFIACVGVAFMAASSAARAALSRLTPSGMAWISLCSVMIALSSISGRGGQPGR